LSRFEIYFTSCCPELRCRPAEQVEQLGDVHGDAPGVVAGEELISERAKQLAAEIV
jgi:hypothetical protein